ncbi:MAG: hypothetical protein ACTHLA_15105 [Asticcacaulis sp.]|uniref:hypothetical protein n=1 Tax=Asticcacaulis sp. TaxID=1872648 RepID=UPI003F7C7318
MKILPLAGMMVLTLAACSPAADQGGGSAESAAPSMTAAEASSLMASEDASGLSGSLNVAATVGDYVGQWRGPEGTSLTITPSGDRYAIEIRDLDGPRDFTGDLRTDGLHFNRDGKALIIHPGDGAATGMKWLADKSDCLVVDANEGYCRD